MMRVFAPALAVVLILTANVPARAESLWAMEGIGLWSEGYDLAARGAGSTAIGVQDERGMSVANPAQAAWARLPQIHFAVVMQDRWIRSDASPESDRRADARLPGIRAVIPGPARIRFALGYRDVTDGAYRVEFTTNAGREDEFRRTLRGSGGLGEFYGGLAYSLPGNWAAIGLHLGYAQGTLQDIVEDAYASDVFADTKSTLRTRMERLSTWSLGIQGTPLDRLNLGAVVQGGSDLDLKGIWKEGVDGGWEEKAVMKYPAGFGLGAVYRFTTRNRVAVDFNHRAWSGTDFRRTDRIGNVEQPGGGFTGLEDTRRIGVGLTRSAAVGNPKDPLLRRAVWRLGFSWGEYPVPQWSPVTQRPGATVSEWAVSWGLGLPIQVDRGFVDGLLELGQAGDLDRAGLRENFVRVGLGVTFGRFQSQF